jgi:hypothetical protein
LLLDLPLPPQAATAMAAVTTRAIAAGAIAILLRTIFSSWNRRLGTAGDHSPLAGRRGQ